MTLRSIFHIDAYKTRTYTAELKKKSNFCVHSLLHSHHQCCYFAPSNGLNEQQTATSISTGRREKPIMLNNNNNKMDIPLNNMQDAGRLSPVNGNNDHSKNFVSFGFTQEQVECVCEVSVSSFLSPSLSLTFQLFCIRLNELTSDFD